MKDRKGSHTRSGRRRLHAQVIRYIEATNTVGHEKEVQPYFLFSAFAAFASLCCTLPLIGRHLRPCHEFGGEIRRYMCYGKKTEIQ
jgi:hypothetical protein